jgi:hypothetical protein
MGIYNVLRKPIEVGLIPGVVALPPTIAASSTKALSDGGRSISLSQ